MRPLFIAGNWKMNPPGEAQAVVLAQEIKKGVAAEVTPRVALCPPSVFLKAVDDVLAGSPIGLGAQNLSPRHEGAFTGEVSGAMLVDVGCTHAIIGHSERRHGMGETNVLVNEKLFAALKFGLIPIVCIGETLDERAAGETETVLAEQLAGSLLGIMPEALGGIVLAYEPVWAIGTGQVATPVQAQAVHCFIRDWITERFGVATADRLTVLYGGSVKPDNAGELLSCPDIDGALVGGASLKAEDFLAIIAAARAVDPATKV